MTITMSKPVQQTAVGEGFALGCVALGCESFNDQKLSIELAFAHAWRRWPYSSRFPAVRGDDIIGIIGKSPRRRSAHLSGWANEWPFEPYIADGWDAVDVADLLASEAEIPLAGWRDLAQTFFERLSGTKMAG